MADSMHQRKQVAVRAEAPARAARFPAYLRRCRRERKLSLRQVEKLSESYPERVSNSYLAYCETGRLLPSLDKLITLSKVLGVPLQSFIERVELDMEAEARPDPRARTTWQELRSEGIAEAERGRLALAYARFERAHGLAGTPAARADLKMDMAIVLKRMSRHYSARDLLEEALSDLPDTGPGSERVERALVLLAGVLREMGRPPIAAIVARQAMERAARAGDRAQEGHAATALANALFDMGDAQAAAPLYETAARVFRGGAEPAHQATSLANLGNCQVRCGRFAEGVRTLREAEALARRHGFARQIADVLGYLGRAYRQQEDLARAEKHLRLSNQEARGSDFHDILFGNTWHLREIALRGSREAEAADLLRRLRYLRGRVDGSSSEVRAYDRMFSAAEESAVAYEPS